MRWLAPLVCLVASAQDAPKPTISEGAIDAYFDARWRSAQVKPGEPADDTSFLRRLTLDAAGRLPTPDEVRLFGDDKSADKRAKAIDRLLASEEFAEYVSDVWLDALVDHEVTNQDFARAHFGAFRSWLRRAVHEDIPYSEFVRSLVADRGGRHEKPAVNYALKHLGTDQLPVKLAIMNARLFLGRDIRCAQCHDHPFDTMTQDEFWGFANFMRPLRNRGALVDIGLRYDGAPREDIGELFVKPKFFDGEEPREDEPLGDALARFILSTTDSLHARAYVERVWKQLFSRTLTDAKGRGHRELLDRLTRDFVAGGESPKKLWRAILRSRVYQMSSAGKETARAAYAAGPLKVMNPQQYFNVFQEVFDLREAHKTMYEKLYKNPNAGEQFRDPQVMRMMMFDWAQDLLFPKGRSPEEANASTTVRMAMKFMNNKRVLSMMIWQWGTLKKVLNRKSKPSDRIDELFLAMLSRKPTADERATFVDYIREASDDKKAYEDVLWVLINSAEFLFVH